MNSLNKSTLSEQIYQILKNDIITQEIKCGEKLTLKNLKERFQVSSTPIREALTKLTQDNLVNYYSNIGVKVVEFDDNDLHELYEFIRELDTLAVKFCMKLEDKSELIKCLKDNLDKNLYYLNNNNPEEGSALSDEFHLIFYNYCNNSRIVDAYKKVFLQLSIFYRNYKTDVESQLAILKEHQAIYNAICDDDKELATKLMYEHLSNSFEIE